MMSHFNCSGVRCILMIISSFILTLSLSPHLKCEDFTIACWSVWSKKGEGYHAIIESTDCRVMYWTDRSRQPAPIQLWKQCLGRPGERRSIIFYRPGAE